MRVNVQKNMPRLVYALVMLQTTVTHVRGETQFGV